tara:strand:+ start:1757 stop:2398 length:642 start_codon:yes stop_codon:yes gene_type:complete
MQTAISAKTGYADVWFIEIAASNTTLRYTTAPSNVTWNSLTWTGIGGLIEFDPPPETADPSGQSLGLTLSGVDTTMITEVLDHNLRGRDCRLYWGQIVTSTGVVVVDAIEVFGGLMNASWHIEHTPSDQGTRGTVKVSTTIVSEMARYMFRRMLRTNPTSLALMQARGGITPTNPDTFFATLPALMGQPVYWGRKGTAANPGGVSYYGTSAEE